MELKKVYVDGYRNVTDVWLSLNNITSVLSVNNFGKSNFLEAIVFGLNFLQQHSRTKQTMISDVKSIPILKRTDEERFTFGMECYTVLDGKDYYIRYNYSFIWEGHNKEVQGKIDSELLQISENDKDFTTFIKREGENAFYKSSKKGRCATTAQVDDYELVINKLFAFDHLFYHEIIKELLNINVYVDRHFDTTNDYGITFMSEPELTELTLKPDSNIPKTLYRIKQEYPDKYTLLEEIFKAFFPSIKGFLIEEFNSDLIHRFAKNKDKKDVPEFSDKVYILYVRDNNLKYAVNFKAMSDGARRILLLLTFIILADINHYDLICIEEPENSINPGLLRKFVYSINELSANTKILFSSHSPYLINYMEASDVYIGIPASDGTARFGKIKSNLNNLKRLTRTLQDNNLGLGEYLFDLMSGTPEDQEELLSYVR